MLHAILPPTLPTPIACLVLSALCHAYGMPSAHTPFPFCSGVTYVYYGQCAVKVTTCMNAGQFERAE